MLFRIMQRQVGATSTARDGVMSTNDLGAGNLVVSPYAVASDDK